MFVQKKAQEHSVAQQRFEESSAQFRTNESAATQNALDSLRAKLDALNLTPMKLRRNSRTRVKSLSQTARVIERVVAHYNGEAAKAPDFHMAWDSLKTTSSSTETNFMPKREIIEKAREDKCERKPPSTQAEKFVRKEFHHMSQGKRGVRQAKQAIAIGLSKFRHVCPEVDQRARASQSIRNTTLPSVSSGLSIWSAWIQWKQIN